LAFTKGPLTGTTTEATLWQDLDTFTGAGQPHQDSCDQASPQELLPALTKRAATKQHTLCSMRHHTAPMDPDGCNQ